MWIVKGSSIIEAAVLGRDSSQSTPLLAEVRSRARCKRHTVVEDTLMHKSSRLKSACGHLLAKILDPVHRIEAVGS